MKFIKEEEKSLSDTLSEAIKSYDENNYRNKSKRRFNKSSPWFSLPNCKKFSITINMMDPIFRHFGIRKRMKPDLRFEKYSNNYMNRYAEYQIKRLEKLRDNPLKYWKLSELLMKKSSVFRILAINQSFPNWYKNLPLSRVISMNKKVSDIINKRKGNLEYKRVYIPKNETFRPLGVPTPEWRMYLHMLNNFLVFYLSPNFLNSQHGFIPGKGTLSAWKDLFQNEILESKYIYEFDLKNCFGEIRSDKVHDELLRLGLPKKLCDQILKINTSLPKLPAEEKLDESLIQEKKDFLNFPSELIKGSNFVWKSINGGTPRLVKGNQSSTEDFVVNSWALSKKIYQGLPQGSAISPTLTILMLNKFLRQNKSLSYADDGLFYSEEEFKVLQQKSRGIILNEKKSGWVKFDGEWIKPLKFLGLVYDGENLQSQTRSGKSLMVSEDMTALGSLIENLESQGAEVSCWSIKKRATNVLNTRIGGFIQSRLYNGSLNLQAVEQDFTYSPSKNSWGYLKGTKLNTFNASSYACKSLGSIIKKNMKNSS